MKKTILLMCCAYGIFGGVWGKSVCVYMPTATNGTAITDNPASATFTVTFSWGTVSGYGLCSKSSTEIVYDSPYKKNMVHCWCKLYDPLLSVSVYSNEEEYHDDCLESCPFNCASQIRTNATFRQKIFQREADANCAQW